MTKELHNKHLVGLPLPLVGKLAGDFDGDEYDLVSVKDFPNIAKLVQIESHKAMLNPKISKTFTPRQQVGNFERISISRLPILQRWVSIVNRFYYLNKDERKEFSNLMAANHELDRWQGENWAENLKIEKNDSLNIVIAEMQLGVKIGEDIFKTSADIDSVLNRASEYENALEKFGSSFNVPYSSKIIARKLSKTDNLTRVTFPSLAPSKNSNLVHKAFRGLARYFNEDLRFRDYLSDDEDSGDSDLN